MANITKPVILDETGQSIASAISTMSATSIGNLSELDTTDKTSLVGAVNELKSGLTSVTTTMPNQIPPNDTPNDFNDMYDRALTMYRIGDTTSMTNAPANGLYGVVIAYRFGAYILQVFHHSNGLYQRFSFDSGATWGAWLQIK